MIIAKSIKSHWYIGMWSKIHKLDINFGFTLFMKTFQNIYIFQFNYGEPYGMLGALSSNVNYTAIIRGPSWTVQPTVVCNELVYDSQTMSHSQWVQLKLEVSIAKTAINQINRALGVVNYEFREKSSTSMKSKFIFNSLEQQLVFYLILPSMI